MINDLVPKMKFIAGRGGLLLKKHAPDILFGLGVTGMVGSAVMASKASVNLNKVREDNADIMQANMMSMARQGIDEESIEYKQVVGKLYLTASGKYVKMYAPAVSLGVASIVVLFVGHQKTKQRVASAMAAYALIDKAYGQYRERVVDKYGEEVDNTMRFGKPEKRTYTEVDEDGKKSKVKNRVYVLDDEASPYAKFFDEYSTRWRSDSSMNLYFLKTQQSYFNDLLVTRGHVFLNEVWDALGIPRTKAGAIVGWVKADESVSGDGYIDLGLYTDLNAAFINGHECSVMIDPNVDGVIYDLL